MSRGKLYLVPTPIGNLKDMTFRAIEVLKGVDMILTEDTRTSGVLLKHFDITTPTRSYHMFNEHKTLDSWVKQIDQGMNLALISDAGTPGISDPGFLLSRECLKNEIEVECLPGSTALIPALVNSGLPSERFCFEGFLPVKKGRQTRIKELAVENRTMIFYESPHRILKTLMQFKAAFGEARRASISREISKLHEETIRGSLEELVKHFEEHPPKGEFVLIVAGKKV